MSYAVHQYLITKLNPTVHIALNIAADSSVAVDMSNMVNTVLHVSLNNAARCQVDVKIDKAYNSSIHLRFAA